jgi:hypothetical protein
MKKIAGDSFDNSGIGYVVYWHLQGVVASCSHRSRLYSNRIGLFERQNKIAKRGC